jgi:hypothetical protein
MIFLLAGREERMKKRWFWPVALFWMVSALCVSSPVAQTQSTANGSESYPSRRRATYAASEADYFPLVPGTEWGFTDGLLTAMVKVRTTSPVPLGNEGECRLLENWFFPFQEGQNAIRAQAQGMVTDCDSQGGNKWWYRFGPGDGSRSWIFNGGNQVPCITGSRVTILSPTETVDTPVGRFRDCLHLSFSSVCRDNGITDEYFAPGFGLVRRIRTTFAGPVVSELVSARVPNAADRWGAGLELSLDQTVYYNNYMPPVVDPAPKLKARLLIYNATSIGIPLEFPDSQRFDFVVRDPSGTEWLKWSDRRNFLQVIGREVLPGGWTQIYGAVLKLTDHNSKPLPSGDYVLSGFLTARQAAVNPVPPFSGTFRFTIQDVH